MNQEQSLLSEAMMNKYVRKIQNFFIESKRILKISKKPNKEEYLKITKVSAIGIAIIGLIGFLIQIIGQMLGMLGK